MSALEIISGHLSVSSRVAVTAEQLGKVLRSGVLEEAGDPIIRALVAGLFAETEVDLIMRATYEAGGNAWSAQSFYLESVSEGLPASPAWENYMAEIL